MDTIKKHQLANNTLPNLYRHFLCGIRRIMLGLLVLTLSEVAVASGVLMLVGNVLPLNNKIVWRNIVNIADRIDGENLVVAAAHRRPALYGKFALRAFQRYGESASLLPLAEVFQEFSTDYRYVVEDQEFNDRVRASSSVFFVGGAPQRLSRVLIDRNGHHSSMATAVVDAYHSGSLIIGGIPSHQVLSTEAEIFEILHAGLIPADWLLPGLGLVNEDWYIDQNMFGSGRIAGALVAMHQLGLNRGIGVGLDTAVVVQQDRVDVLGNRGVLIIDLSEASFALEEGGIAMDKAKLSYLENGDRIEMATMQVTPYKSKEEGFELLPQFDASGQLEGSAFISSQDIFRSGEFVRLMVNALESEHGVEQGYALHHGQRNGFVFKFYTDNKSRGWIASSSGEYRYTLVNINLDIRPIRHN